MYPPSCTYTKISGQRVCSFSFLRPGSVFGYDCPLYVIYSEWHIPVTSGVGPGIVLDGSPIVSERILFVLVFYRKSSLLLHPMGWSIDVICFFIKSLSYS